MIEIETSQSVLFQHDRQIHPPRDELIRADVESCDLIVIAVLRPVSAVKIIGRSAHRRTVIDRR